MALSPRAGQVPSNKCFLSLTQPVCVSRTLCYTIVAVVVQMLPAFHILSLQHMFLGGKRWFDWYRVTRKLKGERQALMKS